jgi:acylphosphatase
MATESASPQNRWHAFVDGVVQGVGFRYFVRDAAVRLGVTGWVRNRTDGRVEIVAEGPLPTLEALAEEVARGPRAARVERVDVEWTPATGEFSGFRLASTS